MTPLLLVFLAPLNSQAATEAQVTLHGRAARLPVVLAEIAKATNVAMEASPAMANEVVLVHVDKMPLPDVMTKLASVTAGEWKDEGGLLRLTPNQGLRVREAANEKARRLELVRKAIAKRITEMTAAPKEGPADTPPNPFMGGRNPSDQAIYGMLQSVDVAPLAELGPNERVVYSSAPTRMQRALPNSGRFLTNLITEHNAAARARGGSEPTDLPDGVEIPDSIRKMIDRQSKPIGKVSKALLVATRFGMMAFMGTSLELRLYDDKGKVAYSANTQLQTDSTAFQRMMETAAQIGGTAKPPAKSTPVELSPDTKEVQESLAQSGRRGGLQMKPEVYAKLRRPDQYDPLSFLATDNLIALAKKRKQPLIASVPDEMVGALEMVSSNHTVEAFEKQIAEGQTLTLIQDPKCILIRPAQPQNARDHRLDRFALAALLSASAEKEVPSLDDIAAYALRAPDPMDGGVGQVYVAALAPGAIGLSMSGMSNWNAIRFYGTLTPTQRQALTSGYSLAYGQLTSAQQGHLRAVAFAPFANIEVQVDGKKSEDLDMFSFMRMFGMGGDADYRSEPTEILPNGIPSGAQVSAKVLPDYFVVPAGKGNELFGPLNVMGAEELAIFKMFAEDKNLSAVADQLPKLNELKLGNRTTWNFAVQFAPNIALHAVLNDNRMPRNAQTVSMANLPADFQKTIAGKADQLKKSPLGLAGAMMGGMGRQTPPP